MKRLQWISVVLLMLPGMGQAAERLLYDGVMTTEDASNAFYWFGVPEACPSDWTAPDDFLSGQWHARYEIIEQPSYASYGEPTGLQSCIWQDGKGGDYPETCGSVHFLDGPGTLWTVETPADWWEKADSSASATVFDWTRGGDFVDMGSPTWHRNEDGSRCLATIASWGGCEENMDAHLPMTLRISIVIVSAGSVFSGWNAYGLGESGEDGGDGGPGEDAGLDAGVEDASDAGEGEDAGLEDAGLEDAGLEDAGLEDAGLEDAGLEDAGVEDAGLEDAGVPGDSEAEVDGGCGCAAAGSPVGLFGLCLFVCLFAWHLAGRRRGRECRRGRRSDRRGRLRLRGRSRPERAGAVGAAGLRAFSYAKRWFRCERGGRMRRLGLLIGGMLLVSFGAQSGDNGGAKKGGAGPGMMVWVYSKPTGLEFTKSEITVAQYRACMNAGNCTKPKDKSANKSCNWGHADRDAHPVNCVDWNQAKAFCEWAGGRLPTAKEWYAEASSNGKRKYPWGSEERDCERSVMKQRGRGCGRDSTWPVCSKPKGKSVSGLCDMSGNVWEWTSSLGDEKKVWPLACGGSLYSVWTDDLSATGRSVVDPSILGPGYGLRCVRSVKQTH